MGWLAGECLKGVVSALLTYPSLMALDTLRFMVVVLTANSLWLRRSLSPSHTRPVRIVILISTDSADSARDLGLGISVAGSPSRDRSRRRGTGTTTSLRERFAYIYLIVVPVGWSMQRRRRKGGLSDSQLSRTVSVGSLSRTCLHFAASLPRASESVCIGVIVWNF